MKNEKTVTLNFSIGAMQFILAGFSYEVKDHGLNPTPGWKYTRDTLTNACRKLAGEDTAITVCGNEDMFFWIKRAVSFAQSEFESTSNLSVSYWDETYSPCEVAIAELRYGGKCQYCGCKPKNPAYLLVNIGACHKASCVRRSMQAHM